MASRSDRRFSSKLLLTDLPETSRTLPLESLVTAWYLPTPPVREEIVNVSNSSTDCNYFEINAFKAVDGTSFRMCLPFKEKNHLMSTFSEITHWACAALAEQPFSLPGWPWKTDIFVMTVYSPFKVWHYERQIMVLRSIISSSIVDVFFSRVLLQSFNSLCRLFLR